MVRVARRTRKHRHSAAIRRAASRWVMFLLVYASFFRHKSKISSRRPIGEKIDGKVCPGIRPGGAYREPRGFPQTCGDGGADLPRARRAAGDGMLGRRDSGRRGHVLSDGGEEARRRDGGVLLDRLAIEGSP